MAKPILIAMYGLPRSGKTTICRQLSKELGAPVVNRDTIRLALHGQAYIGKAEPWVKAISGVMVEALFLYGTPIVIVDETCYSREARKALLSDKWDTRFWEVPTPPDVCKQRAIDTNQAYLLPVIDEMWARREPLGEDELKYEPPTNIVPEVRNPHHWLPMLGSCSCTLAGCSCADRK